ncbi:MAG TPA: hypothetical protein VNE39_00985 [Planctomycetota bacterium]|nr:hypothetical protein [Planctomycetota bacterium]
MRSLPRQASTLTLDRIEVIDDETADMLRRKTPAERMAMVNEFWRAARQKADTTVRGEHPDWGDARVAAEVARRMTKREEDEG